MDRNGDMYEKASCIYKSPHARVAWIETDDYIFFFGMERKSPHARVAWIETHLLSQRKGGEIVATREGGVDRNINSTSESNHAQRRHPRGWRG